MKILIVNDDGITSAGLKALVTVFKTKHDVSVCAPQLQMSGMGRSISYRKKLSHKEYSGLNVPAYAVDGTPTDCVKYALDTLNIVPDLVISGINYGANAGCDVLYSGTVSAAMEGSFLGIPSIAVSCACAINDNTFNFDYCSQFLFDNLDKLISCIDENRIININIPNIAKENIQGVRVTNLCLHNTQQYYDVSPEGTYGWNDKYYDVVKNMSDCDVKFLHNGYITVTPLSHDLTDFGRLAAVKDILK